MRTRKVRAVTESLYGRTARTIGIIEHGDDLPFFEAAQAEADLEAMRTSEDDCGGFTMRHARTRPPGRASSSGASTTLRSSSRH